MDTKRKSSVAGSASKPKRSHDVLSISKKVKTLDMIEIEKKKIGKLKKQTVHKFQNARQTRTGRNMVKYSSPNAPNT
jgi:hypothetical protein